MVQQRTFAYTAPEPESAADTPSTRVGDVRLLTMLIGGAAGAGIASTSYSATERDPWLIFLLISTLLGIAAGEAFGFGLSRWFEVKQFHVIKRWRVWLSVLFVLIVACGLIAATPYVVEETVANTDNPIDNLTPNGIALSGLAILGGLSIMATLAAIKQVAANPLPGTAGEQLDALLRLRRMTGRMLSQLGLLVLLVMAVNAAAKGWGDVQQNPKVAVFSGVVASLVVALMYVPTASNLRRRGVLFVERHYPLTNVGLGTLITAAEDRGKLEKMLALDQTTFGELRAGLVVLTPVVVGVVASIVPQLLG